MAVSNILLQSLINPPQADFSGALAEGESNALVNRLNTAKVEAAEFGTTPEALARTQRDEELKIQAAETKARQDATDAFNAATDRDRTDAIEAASMFNAITPGDQASLDRFARTHPIDAFESGITIRDQAGEVIVNPNFFGSEQEAAARTGADVVLNAARTREGLGRAPAKPGALKEVTLPNGTPGFVRDRGDGQFEIALGPEGQPLTPKAGSRQRVTVDPNTGQVTFEQGALDNLAKPTVGRIEKDIINIDDSLAELADIEAAFDPRFLKIPFRAEQKLNSFLAKFGADLSDEQITDLGKFSEFQRSSSANINRNINLLSGAAVSPDEATRLLRQFPDPGSGVFDADDPISFANKLKGLKRNLQLAKARRIHLLSEGIDLGNLSEAARNREFDRLRLPTSDTDIGGIVGVMNKRSLEVRTQAVAAGEDPTAAVAKMLKEEFDFGGPD